MTREEAIKIINCYDIGFYDLSGEKIPAYKLADAFDMAIEALSEPSGANLINRHDATTVIREECWKCNNLINADLLGRILALPSADRPTGNWVSEIDEDVWYLKCSECGCRVRQDKYFLAVGEKATKCPYCGAELGHGGLMSEDYANE